MTQIKPSLVLLHGWGIGSGCWNPLLPLLQAEFQVRTISLPGYSANQSADPSSEAEILDRIEQQIASPAILVGWSLGGMWASKLAHSRPHLVEKLVLIATNPVFCATDDWPQGLPRGQLQRFQQDLLQDPQRTLQQFVALQFMGVLQGRQMGRKMLREAEDVAVPVLRAGLDHLSRLDVRSALSELTLPVLAIYGALDRLVPETVASRVSALGDHIQVRVLAEAGHAPFISHPAEVMDNIAAFIQLTGFRP